MTFLARYIMRGRLAAMMVASSLAVLSFILPPISIISCAAIALVTLKHGSGAGFYLMLISCLAAGLLGTILLGDFVVAMLYSLVLWPPIWVLALVLSKNGELSAALQTAVAFGIILVVVFYIYNGFAAAEVWQPFLQASLDNMLSSGVDISDQAEQSVKEFPKYMTGAMTATVVGGLLFSLCLARMWQAALYNPGGFIGEYLSIKASPKMAVASIVLLAIAWLANGAIAEICANILWLFALLYIFIGSAVAHSVLATFKFKRFAIPAMYITQVLIPNIMALVIIIGVTDTWLNLRWRLSKKTGS